MDYEKINREERKLIQDCLDGKPLAQQRLFKKFYGFVMAICLRYSCDKDEAKEILQESFIKVFKSLHSFKYEGGLSNWMKRIVVNTAIDKFRSRHAESDKVRMDEKMVIFDENDVVSKMNRDDLLACIKELPVGYRTVFNLYVIEGYTHKDIAERLGISEGTSKSQLFKAKQMLQQMIRKRF